MTSLGPQLVDPRPQSLVNPQAIVEILSESTEAYDRGAKWVAYRMIATLTDYVLVSSVRRELEHYQRRPDGTWTLQTLVGDGTCTLANGVQLALPKLYRLVPGLE